MLMHLEKTVKNSGQNSILGPLSASVVGLEGIGKTSNRSLIFVVFFDRLSRLALFLDFWPASFRRDPFVADCTESGIGARAQSRDRHERDHNATESAAQDKDNYQKPNRQKRAGLCWRRYPVDVPTPRTVQGLSRFALRRLKRLATLGTCR